MPSLNMIGLNLFDKIDTLSPVEKEFKEKYYYKVLRKLNLFDKIFNK